MNKEKLATTHAIMCIAIDHCYGSYIVLTSKQIGASCVKFQFIYHSYNMFGIEKLDKLDESK